MSTTTREFTRSFPVFKRAALSGKTVEVRDREGNAFTFAVKQPAPRTLAEAVAHLAGVARTGQRRKTLRGYGTR